jgi:hypothetical protein
VKVVSEFERCVSEMELSVLIECVRERVRVRVRE